MSFTAVQNALNAQLQTCDGLPPLQLENEHNAPKAAWSRATLMPSRTLQPNVGTGGTAEMNGLYQVDLFYPMNQGMALANAMVDAVIDTFPRGMLIAEDGLFVQIESAWREAVQRDEPFMNVPVTVSWSCLRPN